MRIPPEVWDLLKLLVVPLCLWYLEWRTEKRDDRRALEEAARKKEEAARKKEEDQKTRMILHGLWILSDCQYEVIYDLKNGEHNGGLDTCMEEITSYRTEVKDWISDRAAWNK